MPRPRQCRRVAGIPQVTYYKPRGIPLALLQCVEMTVDELEAIRLADCEHLYHEQAAQQMNVSRQTFGRILNAARVRVADALVNGKALSIADGPIQVTTNSEETPSAADQGLCRRMRRRRCGGRRGHGHDEDHSP